MNNQIQFLIAKNFKKKNSKKQTTLEILKKVVRKYYRQPYRSECLSTSQLIFFFSILGKTTGSTEMN